jgi:hypothetical protein
MRTIKRKKNRNATKKRINKKQKGGLRNVYTTTDILDALKNIKNNTIDIDLDYELCGTIELVNNVYNVILHEVPIIESSSRKMCNYEKYDRIIWHTHPNTSKFYPSIEDIEKIIKLKNSIIQKSYIITKFGIWELTSINHININNSMRNSIQNILDNLYFNTQKGRQYFEEPVNQAIEELNNLLENILVINFIKSD